MQTLNKQSTDCHGIQTLLLERFIESGITGIAKWIKVPILSKRLILFPILRQKHWSLITANPQTQIIRSYDSLNGFDEKTITQVRLFLRTWQAFKQVVPSQWKIIKASTTLQNNNYDCGPIVVENAKRLTFGIPLTFNEIHMQSIRIQHKQEIDNKLIKVRNQLSITKRKRKQKKRKKNKTLKENNIQRTQHTEDVKPKQIYIRKKLNEQKKKRKRESYLRKSREKEEAQ